MAESGLNQDEEERHRPSDAAGVYPSAGDLPVRICTLNQPTEQRKCLQRMETQPMELQAIG